MIRSVHRDQPSQTGQHPGPLSAKASSTAVQTERVGLTTLAVSQPKVSLKTLLIVSLLTIVAYAPRITALFSNVFEGPCYEDQASGQTICSSGDCQRLPECQECVYPPCCECEAFFDFSKDFFH